MNVPNRLREEASGQLAGRLIESTGLDSPTSESLERTVRALSAAGFVPRTQIARPSVAAAASRGVLAGGALKWGVIGVGVTGVALTLGVVGVARRQAVNPPSPSMSVDARPASDGSPPPATPQRPPGNADLSPAGGATDPGASPVHREPSAARQPRPGAAPFSSRSTTEAIESSPSSTLLLEQIAALDRVRHSIRNRDARSALEQLDRYASLYGQGAFGPEATVLHIEALVLSGDRAGARRLAGAFLEHNPRSPHAARVRALAEASIF